MMLEMELCGQALALLPQRAVFWRDAGALLIADPHLGKADAFRRAGIPVPHAVTVDDLSRLSDAIARTQATRLIVLGDLLHARPAQDDAMLEALTGWREEHAALRVQVIAGNHDLHAGPPPEDLGFELIAGDLREGPFRLTHHPSTCQAAYTLAGHVHPGVLAGARPARQTLPCFHFTDHCGTLPAFGRFTGFHRVRPTADDRCYAIGDGEVFAVPAPPRTAGRH